MNRNRSWEFPVSTSETFYGIGSYILESLDSQPSLPARSLKSGARTLWTNPESIVDEIEAAAAGSGSPPRVQFSRSAACTPKVLEQLDQCCRRFGSRIVVCFSGFYKEEFDAEILRGLPSVCALYIDVSQARNLQSLGRLEYLEEFGVGIREGDYPQILTLPGIQAVHRLVLMDNRRNNVDLAPLVVFPNLAHLHLCAHARNIEILEQLTGVRRLALNQMGKSVKFPWLQAMTGLRDLTFFSGPHRHR